MSFADKAKPNTIIGEPLMMLFDRFQFEAWDTRPQVIAKYVLRINCKDFYTLRGVYSRGAFTQLETKSEQSYMLYTVRWILWRRHGCVIGLLNYEHIY